jgi:hypothetical protein
LQAIMPFSPTDIVRALQSQDWSPLQQSATGEERPPQSPDNTDDQATEAPLADPPENR